MDSAGGGNTRRGSKTGKQFGGGGEKRADWSEARVAVEWQAAAFLFIIIYLLSIYYFYFNLI